MRRITLSRPSPAIVVAVLALVAGLTGVALADPEAKKAVTKKKVKKIADKEINKLAPDLSVAHADTAGSAANATNASRLGGVGPGGYQARVRWAIVGRNGGILAQSGGITNTHNPVDCSPGCDYLDFGSSQIRKAIVATPSFADTGTIASDVVAALCGGPGSPGGVVCSAPGTDDTSHIFVVSTNAAGDQADRTYYIAVIG